MRLGADDLPQLLEEERSVSPGTDDELDTSHGTTPASKLHTPPPSSSSLSAQTQTPATTARLSEADLQPPSTIGGGHIMPNYHVVARQEPMGWLGGNRVDGQGVKRGGDGLGR